MKSLHLVSRIIQTIGRACTCILLLLGLFSPAAHAAEPEVRGTWLTTTANDHIANPDNTARTMRRLRQIGLNTVYVECWKNGYTEFPSDVMRRTIGVAMKINPSSSDTPAVQRDLLAECLREAHRNDLVCIAWFEYGFMAAHQSTHNELRARRDWLSLDQQGSDVAKNGFVWLNPLHPDAQSLLIGIVVEAIRKYPDLDGIQLDDRIVWPGLEMGYDLFTQKLYADEHQGRRPPRDISDPQWCAWRAARVEAFARRFVREVRAAAVQAGNPDLIISLSPGPHPWAMHNYLIDWPAWSRWRDNPTWDEYVPQCYRLDYDSFRKSWQEQVEAMPSTRRKDLIAGIRLVGDGPDLPAEDLIKCVQLVRKTGGGGHCWWFSRGVLEVHADTIARLYDVKTNGHAPHPRNRH
ncbi:glycoside hydrolase family 10 protein [Fontivita pretiosa]|uniref:glycoside hydrolase family 10 protein n=1 Tax=Fontivita pretiosa TaxID=2989684 RepID=UPI003D1841DB